MSIQDESFPYDDDLEFSRNSGKNLVFPHHKPRRTSALANNESIEGQQHVSTNSNISTSSPLQNQDDSIESSNDFCPPSETSGKTNASEPNDMQETQKKKSEFIRHNPNKSISYQDIHSEYTKRRFKHVESTVGRYIADIKAQDKKRRNSGKFQRHRSMPETLHGTETTVPELNNDSKIHGVLHHSTNDLDRIHDPHNDLQSDPDTEIYDNLTTTTSSLSTRDLGSDAGILLDKQTFEQLLSDKERKDYLQTKLEEKNAENCRLKLNLEKMRIEYSDCKDKLKQIQTQRFTGSFGSINAVANSLGRTSLHSLLYPQESREKSTQTDRILTPSPVPPLNKQNNDMFATPLTPDSNNNSFDHAAVGMLAPAAHKVSKCVATIQPLSLNFSNLVEQDSRDFNSSNINTTMGFLRQRSNSIAARKKSTPLPANISKVSSTGSSVPSSSDSAIEVTDSPKNQRQSRREEFIYYEQRSQRYSVLETRNAGRNYPDTDHSTSPNNNSIEDGNARGNSRKRHNLRSRVMRFFGACTKCEDHNLSLEAVDKSTHSQIPLLEKSTQNYCRNVR
ncbi:protein swallow [Calliphora vicina]|uniref:protein swallow n=1 Tax=Calliphora vicina TaxID=7373 RepID=UPI00325AC9C5